MLPTTSPDELTFEPAPLSFLALCDEVFSDSAISIAILPLNNLNHQQTETQHRWLHDKEVTQYEKFSLEKRSREWLGGRICAKQSANIFFRGIQNPAYIPKHVQYRVQSEESGRPYFSTLKDLSLDSPELSISHSKAYAAAVTSLKYCGIDIQYSAKTLSRVQEKFCTSSEEHILEEMLPELSPIARLTQLWSAKEAAKKMLSPGGIPGFHELELFKISKPAADTGILFFSRPESSSSIQVIASMFNDDYALAICCARSDKEVH